MSGPASDGPDRLDVLIGKLLEISLPAERFWQAEGPRLGAETWEQNVRSIAGQILLLGTGIGWDKRQAALEEDMQERARRRAEKTEP